MKDLLIEEGRRMADDAGADGPDEGTCPPNTCKVCSLSLDTRQVTGVSTSWAFAWFLLSPVYAAALRTQYSQIHKCRHVGMVGAPSRCIIAQGPRPTSAESLQVANAIVAPGRTSDLPEWTGKEKRPHSSSPHSAQHSRAQGRRDSPVFATLPIGRARYVTLLFYRRGLFFFSTTRANTLIDERIIFLLLLGTLGSWRAHLPSRTTTLAFCHRRYPCHLIPLPTRRPYPATTPQGPRDRARSR